MATAIIAPNKTPRIVSTGIRALSESGPSRNAIRMLPTTAARVTFSPKNIPTAAPANAPCAIVNPIDEIFIWVIRTASIPHPTEAKSMASVA